VACPPATSPHVKLMLWTEERQDDRQEALHSGTDNRDGARVGGDHDSGADSLRTLSFCQMSLAALFLFSVGE